METISLQDAKAIFSLDNRARRFSLNTLKFYETQLTNFFVWCENQNVYRLEDLTPRIIRLFLIHLQEKNLKDHSIFCAAIAIRRFCNFCLAEGLLPESPMKKVAMPDRDKNIIPALTQDQIKKLVKATDTKRDEVLVLFLLDSLLRASECLSLNMGDIDLQTGEIKVFLGKGRKDRTAYIGAKTTKLLLRYLLQRGPLKDSDPVWISLKTGKRLTLTGIDQLFRRLRRKTSLQVTPHTLRRTGCLFLLRAGMSVYHLARLMGHTDISTLRHYLDLVQEDVREAYNKFGIVDNIF